MNAGILMMNSNPSRPDSKPEPDDLERSGRESGDPPKRFDPSRFDANTLPPALSNELAMTTLPEVPREQLYGSPGGETDFGEASVDRSTDAGGAVSLDPASAPPQHPFLAAGAEDLHRLAELQRSFKAWLATNRAGPRRAIQTVAVIAVGTAIAAAFWKWNDGESGASGARPPSLSPPDERGAGRTSPNDTKAYTHPARTSAPPSAVLAYSPPLSSSGAETGKGATSEKRVPRTTQTPAPARTNTAQAPPPDFLIPAFAPAPQADPQPSTPAPPPAETPPRAKRSWIDLR
jgi:hypothetical protein